MSIPFERTFWIYQKRQVLTPWAMMVTVYREPNETRCRWNFVFFHETLHPHKGIYDVTGRTFEDMAFQVFEFANEIGIEFDESDFQQLVESEIDMMNDLRSI